MFGKKPKKQGPPDLSKQPILPNDLAEHAQAMAGMSSEEIIKLLETLGRIDQTIVVTRRRPVKGKNVSKEVGGRQRRMTIEEAVEYEKKRAEERLEKEKRIKELAQLDERVFERNELNDEIYPKRLTPQDIVRSIDAAKERLAELERLRATQSKVFSPKEEAVLDVLTQVKRYEAVRVARTIAEKQRESVIGKTIEELEALREARIRRMKGEPEPIIETEEEKAERIQKEEEEKQEAIRTLTGFDSHFKPLTDEAGELVGENLDAAASVVRQWIGNIVKSE